MASAESSGPESTGAMQQAPCRIDQVLKETAASRSLVPLVLVCSFGADRIAGRTVRMQIAGPSSTGAKSDRLPYRGQPGRPNPSDFLKKAAELRLGQDAHGS